MPAIPSNASIDCFTDFLQNEHTHLAAYAFRCWLIAACQKNGDSWDVESLANSFAAHAAAMITAEERGTTPEFPAPMPTAEQIAEVVARFGAPREQGGIPTAAA